jgi:hypothetical protein
MSFLYLTLKILKPLSWERKSCAMDTSWGLYRSTIKKKKVRLAWCIAYSLSSFLIILLYIFIYDVDLWLNSALSRIARSTTHIVHWKKWYDYRIKQGFGHSTKPKKLSWAVDNQSKGILGYYEMFLRISNWFQIRFGATPSFSSV